MVGVVVGNRSGRDGAVGYNITGLLAASRMISPAVSPIGPNAHTTVLSFDTMTSEPESSSCNVHPLLPDQDVPDAHHTWLDHIAAHTHHANSEEAKRKGRMT